MSLGKKRDGEVRDKVSLSWTTSNSFNDLIFIAIRFLVNRDMRPPIAFPSRTPGTACIQACCLRKNKNVRRKNATRCTDTCASFIATSVSSVHRKQITGPDYLLRAHPLYCDNFFSAIISEGNITSHNGVLVCVYILQELSIV